VPAVAAQLNITRPEKIRAQVRGSSERRRGSIPSPYAHGRAPKPRRGTRKLQAGGGGRNCDEVYGATRAPATYFLTDFLPARSFRQTSSGAGLGLDRYPELGTDYSGNLRTGRVLRTTGGPTDELSGRSGAFAAAKTWPAARKCERLETRGLRGAGPWKQILKESGVLNERLRGTRSWTRAAMAELERGWRRIVRRGFGDFEFPL